MTSMMTTCGGSQRVGCRPAVRSGVYNDAALRACPVQNHLASHQGLAESVISQRAPAVGQSAAAREGPSSRSACWLAGNISQVRNQSRSRVMRKRMGKGGGMLLVMHSGDPVFLNTWSLHEKSERGTGLTYPVLANRLHNHRGSSSSRLQDLVQPRRAEALIRPILLQTRRYSRGYCIAMGRGLPTSWPLSKGRRDCGQPTFARSV